jgi:hypothetical protein
MDDTEIETLVAEAETLVAMSEQARALADQITARIKAHADAAMAKGNDGLAKKWSTELRFLTAPRPVEALVEVKFDPTVLDGLAIYAAQKVRRMVQAYLGTGRVDPYTEAVLKNASALRDEQGRISNRLVMASLTTKMKVTETLLLRRKAAVHTASTQACSSRKALIALGAGRMETTAKGADFMVDFNHPFVTRVVGSAA